MPIPEGSSPRELAAYDAVVERFGASDAPDLLVAVAKALVNKGITHGQRGEAEQALAVYDAVVERFGASDAPDLLVAVAKALFYKGITHGQRGEAEQELAAYDAVVERFGASDAGGIARFVRRITLRTVIVCCRCGRRWSRRSSAGRHASSP